MTSTILYWIRSDFRLRDNPAFFHAIAKAKLQPPMNMVAMYVISPEDWVAHDVAKVKIDFILRNLKILSEKLWETYKIPLLLKTADKKASVPSLILKECEELNVKHVLFNKEYEVNEAKRDAQVLTLLTAKGIQYHTYDDQVVVPPGTLRSKSSNTVYTVYSPYKKTWFESVHRNKPLYLKLYDSLVEGSVNSPDFRITPDKIPEEITGFELSSEMKKTVRELYPAGEEYAHKKLDKFASTAAIGDYNDKRNFPILADGTSGMSPYLASGVVSAKQCVVRAIEANHGKLDTGNSGIVTWVQEIIWRDFYRHILVAYPRVCKNIPFKVDTMRLEWRNDEKSFKAWCDGKTGYPIVDAGMRQLKATGWMHNRVRMIVASFLSKHLLIHWMKGEKYFMQNLIDGDFASNNGGWQWAASTGTDAQPYFRVFNPYLQSKKFDAKGEYIRKWVPELRGVKNAEALHDPEAALGSAGVLKLGYVPKIVQHEFARKRAIDAFKSLSNKNTVEEDSDEEEDGKKRKKATGKVYGKSSKARIDDD